MDADRDINGQKYRIGKLTPKEQFHVARRLVPLLTGLAGAAMPSVLAGVTDAAALTDDALGQILLAFSGGLSKMSNEDSEYVIDTCLSAVQRKQGEIWAPVLVKGGMMFADIRLPDMVQLVVAVVQENLGSFFPGAAAPPATQSPAA